MTKIGGSSDAGRSPEPRDVERTRDTPQVTGDRADVTSPDAGAGANAVDPAQEARDLELSQQASAELRDTRVARAQEFAETGQRPTFAPGGPMASLQEMRLNQTLDRELPHSPIPQEGGMSPIPQEVNMSPIPEQLPALDAIGDPAAITPEVADPGAVDPTTAVPDLEVVDLSQGIDVDALGDTIGRLTNERGEAARLGFSIEGAAAINGGPVEVGAWGDLGIQVSQADTGATVLSFDAEVAATAGIDLGLFEVEVAAGGSYQASARFANSTDAARWIGQQLDGVNETVGRDIFDLRGPDGGAPDLSLSREPTIATQAGILGQVAVEVEASDIPGLPDNLNLEGGFSVRRDVTGTTFQVPGEDGALTTFEGAERTTTYEASVQYGRFSGSFTRTNSEITGDPTIDNNGIYRNDRGTLTFTASDMRDTPAMENAVAGLLGFDGPPALGSPARGMFDDAMQLMRDDGFREQIGARGSVTLAYERNYTQEANGEMALQYGRLSLQTGVSAGFEREIRGVGELSVNASATHSEVLFEHIGTQTETYARGVALRSSPDAWQDFAAQNGEALGTMVQNGAGGELAQQLGLPDPATVFQEQGPQAGIQALADVWAGEDQRFRANEGIILGAADTFVNGSGDTQLGALQGLADNPQQLAGVFDELARRGYTDREIRDQLDGNAFMRGIGLSDGPQRAAAFDQLQAQAAPFRAYGDAAAQDVTDTIHHQLFARGYDDPFTHGGMGRMLSEFSQTASPAQAQQVLQQLADMGVQPEQLQGLATQAIQGYGHTIHGQHADRFQAGVQALLAAAGQ